VTLEFSHFRYEKLIADWKDCTEKWTMVGDFESLENI
jgi:hypothetical protein